MPASFPLRCGTQSRARNWTTQCNSCVLRLVVCVLQESVHKRCVVDSVERADGDTEGCHDPCCCKDVAIPQTCKERCDYVWATLNAGCLDTYHELMPKMGESETGEGKRLYSTRRRLSPLDYII